MTFYHCDFLEKTGLVTAVCTEKDTLCRRNNREDTARIASALGVSGENVFVTKQEHTDIVRIIDSEDPLTQKSCFRLSTMLNEEKQDEKREPCDGFVTDNPGVLLCSYEADCMPVFFLDPVKKAVAMVHSGWRGTAGKISVNAVEIMREKYGSDPKNILAETGPFICEKCYEVGPELKSEFMKKYSEEETESFFIPGKGDRFYLDLFMALKISLLDAGLSPENIANSGKCTFHDGMFCSYRRDGEREHRMITAIMLKTGE